MTKSEQNAGVTPANSAFQNVTDIVRVKKIIHTSLKDGFVILRAAVLKKKRGGGWRETATVKTFLGYFHSVYPNDIFEITSQMTEHKYHGEQWNIMFYRRIYPGTLDEIRQFLLSKHKGIGPKRIDTLIEKYGLGVLSEIETNPNVFDGLGIPATAAQSLRDEIIGDKVFEQTLVFLQMHKIDCRYTIPLFNEYKAQTLDILKNAPYTPYMESIIDFRAADTLFAAAGGEYNDPYRIAMAVYACLRYDTNTNGNIFISRKWLPIKCDRFLSRIHSYGTPQSFSDPEYDAAISLLVEKELILVDETTRPGVTCIYLRENYECEARIARCILAIRQGFKDFRYDKNDIADFLTQYQSRYGISFASAQQAAVYMALTEPISILTGGPGTGKTQTINTILAAIQEMTPNATIRLAAPTGKAANRMSELCNRPAATIHRMLGLGSHHCRALEAGELDCDFLIVDEFSMSDIYLTFRLLRAVSAKTRVILVGDYDQLPSVGPGLVLRDLINSGCVPYTRLNQIFRQKGGSNIVRNAHLIINSTDDGPVAPLRRCTGPHGDFYFLPAESPSEIKKVMIKVIERFHSAYGYAYDDIQVLSPMKAPDVGVTPLNALLQERLNPNGAVFYHGDREFRLGDKVLHCVNNYELEVFNGETGYIKSFGYTVDSAIEVAYPDRDVWYDLQSIDQLELAYAISVHKSQGAEFPIVIIPVHESLSVGLNRNLLYTGITRGKKIVVIIGSRDALYDGIKKSQTVERSSNLIARLQRILPPLSKAA